MSVIDTKMFDFLIGINGLQFVVSILIVVALLIGFGMLLYKLGCYVQKKVLAIVEYLKEV